VVTGILEEYIPSIFSHPQVGDDTSEMLVTTYQTTASQLQRLQQTNLSFKNQI
jgi:hypothetical protein